MFNILIYLLLFILLYAPLIHGVNSWWFIGIFSNSYLLLHILNLSKYLYVMKLFYLYSFLGWCTIYLCYIVFIINQTPARYAYVMGYILFSIIPSALVIVIYCRDKKITLSRFLHMILNVGILQAVISIVLFICPNLHDIVLQFMFQNANASNEHMDVYFLLSNYRMYGFANGLNFTTPVLQSILSVFSFNFLLRQRKIRYLIFMLLLFISASINARTAIFVALLGYIMVFIHMVIRNRSRSFHSLRYVVIFVVLGVTALITIKHINYDTYWWIERGFFSTFDYWVRGNETGIFSYWKDKFYLPSAYNLFWGTGERTMHINTNNILSDIGYVNDIYLGGLFYCIFVYSGFIYCIKRIIVYFRANNNDAICWYFVVLTLFIINMKGYIFSANNVTSFIFLVYCYTLHLPSRTSSKKEGYCQ